MREIREAAASVHLSKESTEMVSHLKIEANDDVIRVIFSGVVSVCCVWEVSGGEEGGHGTQRQEICRGVSTFIPDPHSRLISPTAALQNRLPGAPEDSTSRFLPEDCGKLDYIDPQSHFSINMAD